MHWTRGNRDPERIHRKCHQFVLELRQDDGHFIHFIYFRMSCDSLTLTSGSFLAWVETRGVHSSRAETHGTQDVTPRVWNTSFLFFFFLNVQPPNLSWHHQGNFPSHRSQMNLHNCEKELLFSVYRFFFCLYIHTSTIPANKKFPHSPTCHLQEGRHEKIFPAGSSYLQHNWYDWRQLQSTWTVYSQTSSH